MNNEYVYNDQKQVAIRHYNANRAVMSGPSAKTYAWEPRHNIAIAWVDEVDVPFFLQKKRGCCGETRNKFYLATQGAVDTWLIE